MNNAFPDARSARNRSINDLVVFREIRGIEEAILESIELSLLTTTVANTGMTDPQPDANPTSAELFFIDWRAKTQSALTAQMNEVINYFQVRGYTITRVTTNNRTFEWVIRW